jgi:hypothetical protein
MFRLLGRLQLLRCTILRRFQILIVGAVVETILLFRNGHVSDVGSPYR